jgi:hypothetical protein
MTTTYIASWDYSEQRRDLPYTHLNYMTILMTFSWFPPYLGGGSVGNLTPALLPLHLFARGGAGGVAGWVLPCFQSVLTRGRGWGQRTDLTYDNLYISYVLRSMFPGIFFPNSSPNPHLQSIVLPYMPSSSYLQ